MDAITDWSQSLETWQQIVLCIAVFTGFVQFMQLVALIFRGGTTYLVLGWISVICTIILVLTS